MVYWILFSQRLLTPYPFKDYWNPAVYWILPSWNHTKSGVIEFTQSRVTEYAPCQGLLNTYPVRGYWISTQSRVIESLAVESHTVEAYWFSPSWNPTQIKGYWIPPARLLNTLPVRAYLIPTQSEAIEFQPSQGLLDPHIEIESVPLECRMLSVIESLPVEGYWISPSQGLLYPTIQGLMNPLEGYWIPTHAMVNESELMVIKSIPSWTLLNLHPVKDYWIPCHSWLIEFPSGQGLLTPHPVKGY